MLLMLLFF